MSTLKECEKRVNIISHKHIREGIDDHIEAVKESFCILMDWEIKPEDIVKCDYADDGIFNIETKNGSKFTYDEANDCLC